MPLVTELYDDETVLPDDYPVYWDYAYIADNMLIFSPIRGTVRELKASEGYKEVRRCNITKRTQKEQLQ